MQGTGRTGGWKQLLEIPPLVDMDRWDMQLSVIIRFPVGQEDDFDSVECSLVQTMDLPGYRVEDRSIGRMSIMTSSAVPLDWEAFDRESAEMEELFSLAFARMRAPDRTKIQQLPFLYLDHLEIEPNFQARGLGTLFLAHVLERLHGETAFVVVLPWPPGSDDKTVHADPHDLYRLQRFYNQLGFVPLWDTPFMYAAPWTLQPPLKRALL